MGSGLIGRLIWESGLIDGLIGGLIWESGLIGGLIWESGLIGGSFGGLGCRCCRPFRNRTKF